MNFVAIPSAWYTNEKNKKDIEEREREREISPGLLPRLNQSSSCSCFSHSAKRRYQVPSSFHETAKEVPGDSHDGLEHFSPGINQPWQSVFINSVSADPTVGSDTCKVLSSATTKRKICPRPETKVSTSEPFYLNCRRFSPAQPAHTAFLVLSRACPRVFCIPLSVSLILSHSEPGAEWREDKKVVSMRRH